MAAFLTLAALQCAISSAATVQLAHRAGPGAAPVRGSIGLVVGGLLLAGLGCLIWSRGV